MRLTSRGPELSELHSAFIEMLSVFPGSLSPDAALRLLGKIAGPDPGEICQTFVDRRMTHVLHAACGGAELPAHAGAPLALAQQVIDAIAECHLGELALACAAFAEEGIGSVVPKGLFFSHSVYPGLPRPFSGDLDLLVRRRDFDQARRILEVLGYRQGLVVRRNSPVQLPQDHVARIAASPWFHGQAPAYTRLVRAPQLDQHADFARRMFPFHLVVASGQVFLRPAIDLHYSLNSLAEDTGKGDRPDEKVWWTQIQPVKAEPIGFCAPSDLTVSWFAAHHLYTDAKLYSDVSWKLLADIVAFARAGRVDYAALAAKAERFAALRPAIHYTYRALAMVFDVDVPEDFLAVTAAPSGAPASDLGDLLPALFALRCDFVLDKDQ